MKSWNKTLPKLKKGAWFVPIRNSYLPRTPQAWLLHLILLLAAVAVIINSFDDTRSLAVATISMLLELIGLGAIFTYIASKKS